MKKIFIILFTLFAQFAWSQNQDIANVAVQDRQDYETYLTICQKIDTRLVSKVGKVKLLMVNGQYKDSLGNYFVSQVADTFWYSPTTNVYTFQPNELRIDKSYCVLHQYRIPSAKDFYLWYMVDKYQYRIDWLNYLLKPGCKIFSNDQQKKEYADEVAKLKLKIAQIQKKYGNN